MNKRIYKEKTLHGTPTFPIALYYNNFVENDTILAPLHYHYEFEFLLAKTTLTVNIENNIYRLKENEALFINSNSLHIISCEESVRSSFAALVFDPSFLCSEGDFIYTKYIKKILSNNIFITPILNEDCCILLKEIIDIFLSKEYSFEFLLKAKILELFALLVKNAPTQTVSSNNPKSEIIKSVLSFIEDNYSDDISLADIADHAHISREYMCRIFSEMSDVSPIVYLNRYRIRQSCKLLSSTDKPIFEISSLCGFNSSSYFNKMFLRFVGCTPKVYRAKTNDAHQDYL